MATVLVIRIPGWRSFAIHLPDRHQLFQDAFGLFRRKVRPRIFAEIEQGNDQTALRLATPKRLMKWRGEWGESPLVAAINSGRSELACSLLQIGGTSPSDGSLAAAAMRGDLLVVRALLAKGKNADEPLHGEESGGMTPLMWATNRNHIAVMQELLAAGANVNAVAEDGSTAAMFTRDGEPQNLESLEVLCRHKADITIKDWRGRNLLREAIDRQRCGGKAEMRLLLERYYPAANFDASNQ